MPERRAVSSESQGCVVVVGAWPTSPAHVGPETLAFVRFYAQPVAKR